eukprot:gene21360-27391_t
MLMKSVDRQAFQKLFETASNDEWAVWSNVEDTVRGGKSKDIQESDDESQPIKVGRDVLAAAPTGSGKTAAFVIPVLSRLGQPHPNKSKSGGGIRALLLAPTKELAEQIYREASRLIVGRKIKICQLKKSLATHAIAKQDKTAFNKYDLLVSTPLRLLSLVRAGAIDLSRLQMIVLDEADKLFEIDSYSKGDADEGGEVSHSSNSKGGKQKQSKKSQESDSENSDEEEDEDEDNEEVMALEAASRVRTSFLSQVDEILSQCPDTKVQRGLFSATIGPHVTMLSESFLSNPIQIAIGKENAGASTIDQKLVFVGREDGKLLAIRQLIQEGIRPPVLLFLQSIERAKELHKELIYDGIQVDVMHAERTQLQREDIIQRFRTGEIWVLICTDLMARGIDFKGVQMVINYDLPQSAVSYIHRIGRTGRAGKKGTAITFFTEDDMPRLRPIANVVKLSGCLVPDWMLAIKHLSTRNKKQLRKKAPMRRHIATGIHVPKKRDEGEGSSGGKRSHSSRDAPGSGNKRRKGN